MLAQMKNIFAPKTIEKTFIFDKIQCTIHSNERIRLTDTGKPLEFDSQYLVNHPSEVLSGRITKLFQIHLPHHSITIEDTLLLQFYEGAVGFKRQEEIQQPKCQNLVEKAVNKKTVLFKNNTKLMGLRDKGDKKNIVKNIVNAFLSYVKELMAEGMKIEKNIRLLQGLIQKTKFNNQLVNGIIDNNELRNYFRMFLSQYAASWVENSRLKSKAIHLEAIALYEELCNQKNQEACRKSGDWRGEVENDQNEYYFQSGINHDLQEEIRHFN